MSGSENSESNGCVLFSGCSTSLLDIEKLIKQVMQIDTLPEGCTLIDDITAYPWTIDNKYYTAQVNVCTCPRRTIGDQTFAESVCAVVLQFDANDASSFEIVRAWLPFIELFDPAVRLLVCDECNDNTGVSFTTVQTWCIDHSFELIELVTDDDDDEDDVVGVARIRSALQAHSWPNLSLKNSSTRSDYIESLMLQASEISLSSQRTTQNDVIVTRTTENDDVIVTRTMENHDVIPNGTTDNNDVIVTRTAQNDDVIDTRTTQNTHITQTDDVINGTHEHTNCETRTDDFGEFIGSGDNTQNSASNDLDSKNTECSGDADEAELLAALGNDDPGTESFEVMFSRLKHMKGKAEKLSDTERRAYAEKVAMSFWRAVGGDEDEIGDLSDSD